MLIFRPTPSIVPLPLINEDLHNLVHYCSCTPLSETQSQHVTRFFLSNWNAHVVSGSEVQQWWDNKIFIFLCLLSYQLTLSATRCALGWTSHQVCIADLLFFIIVWGNWTAWHCFSFCSENVFTHSPALYFPLVVCLGHYLQFIYGVHYLDPFTFE